MTLFAAVGVYLVSRNAQYSFWLAMAAHAQILVGITALGALLVKRTVKIGKEGVEVSDQSEAPTSTATRRRSGGRVGAPWIRCRD